VTGSAGGIADGWHGPIYRQFTWGGGVRIAKQGPLTPVRNLPLLLGFAKAPAQGGRGGCGIWPVLFCATTCLLVSLRGPMATTSTKNKKPGWSTTPPLQVSSARWVGDVRHSHRDGP
jgi:hypothetical protein